MCRLERQHILSCKKCYPMYSTLECTCVMQFIFNHAMHWSNRDAENTIKLGFKYQKCIILDIWKLNFEIQVSPDWTSLRNVKKMISCLSLPVALLAILAFILAYRFVTLILAFIVVLFQEILLCIFFIYGTM